MHKHTTLFLGVLFLFFGSNYAQVGSHSELYKTLLAKDSLLFEVGFNKCNLKPTAALLTEDLEFYHDKGGFQNKEMFLEAMQDNICGDSERKPIRKLTPNTLKIFPLYNQGELYGAIMEGKHEFYIKEPNKELYKTGSALFSGLWVKEAEDWKLKRVYSYHHQPE